METARQAASCSAKSPLRPISSSVRAALTTPSASKFAAAPFRPCAARRSDSPSRVVDRLADLLEVPRRIVHEQPADLGKKLAVASDPRQNPVRNVRHQFVRRRRATGAHGLDQRAQLTRVERLGQVLVHAGGQAALAVAFHRVSGHRDDRHAACPRSARARGWPAVASNPPISGICTSISTASKVCCVHRRPPPRGRWRRWSRGDRVARAGSRPAAG